MGYAWDIFTSFRLTKKKHFLYPKSASITYNLATLQEENCNYSYNKNYISFTLKYCGSEKIFQTLASYS